MQGIAEAFQAELIATANVTKREDGYFLALSVQNIFDNLVVYSNSVPCQNCNAYQVVDKLKELSGAQATPSTIYDEAPSVSGKASDPESALWGEVQKGNSLDDYGAYLTQYPKGKYVALAKVRIKKMAEQEAAEQVQQDQRAWDSANSSATEASYQGYLQTYPQGGYAALAAARITKLRKEAALAEANSSKAGRTFRDCPDCPEMVVIPAGSFDMGSNDAGPDERPVHRVTISRAFAMGKTEVTQAQWKAIMGSNPSKFSYCGDTCPVENMSWDEVKEFIQKLNAKTGKQYRLPSEAEWEYAARAGSTTAYPWGDQASHEYANYGNEECCAGLVQGRDQWVNTAPAGGFPANAFGLYDMSGNVGEWVEDSTHANYTGAPTDGSAWQGDGSQRLIRGGSWGNVSQILRVAKRGVYVPTFRVIDLGFRLAKTLS